MEVIEAMCEAGMLPADEVDSSIIADYWEGALACPSGHVCAAYDVDRVVVAIVGRTAVRTLLYLPCPDGEFSDDVAVAFVALVTAWAAIGGEAPAIPGSDR